MPEDLCKAPRHMVSTQTLHTGTWHQIRPSLPRELRLYQTWSIRRIVQMWEAAILHSQGATIAKLSMVSVSDKYTQGHTFTNSALSSLWV